MFEAVKIRKSGYPFRLPHAEFAATYRWIARKANGWAPIHADPNAHPAEYCRAVLGAVHQDFSQVHIGQTLVLYRAEEYRVLELLKNLALGRVLQYMQAAFRRKMGRTYRSLLRGAIGTMAQALAEVKAEPEIGPREVQLMEVALQQYHDHLGRFGAIFAEYEPPEYEQVPNLDPSPNPNPNPNPNSNPNPNPNPSPSPSPSPAPRARAGAGALPARARDRAQEALPRPARRAPSP